MGTYGSHVEQTYRNAFGLKKSMCIDWLKLNVSLAKRFFGKLGRWAIAIDPSYISKAGKRLHISVVFGRDVHSLLNMVSKSWVLASLILIPCFDVKAWLAQESII